MREDIQIGTLVSCNMSSSNNSANDEAYAIGIVSKVATEEDDEQAFKIFFIYPYSMVAIEEWMDERLLALIQLPSAQEGAIEAMLRVCKKPFSSPEIATMLRMINLTLSDRILLD